MEVLLKSNLVHREECHGSIIVQKAGETHVIADVLLNHALPTKISLGKSVIAQ
jgi:hypothetical protein